MRIHHEITSGQAEIPSPKVTSDSVSVYLLEAVVVLEGCYYLLQSLDIYHKLLTCYVNA